MVVFIRTAIIGCSFGGGDFQTAVEIPDGRVTLRALIQGKVARDVADEIELTPQSDVVFLRLMPFISG